MARLRAQGQLNELRTEDLRFTLTETTAFFNQVMGLSITPENITALEARTEGWIAGLQMAAISLQGREDTADFIRAFSGSHHFVLDYLMKEVIDRQPEGIRDFLLKTSILQRLCAPLCEAVLGIPSGSGQKLLEELELANLFIIPLDNQRHWYRYHHLFGELLRHRLKQNSATGEITALHIRASEWYEANLMAFEAFQHAVDANDVPRAERLVESKEMALHLRTVAMPVLDWLNSLPKDVRDASPRLWVRAATLALMAGRTSTVEQAIAGAEAACKTPNRCRDSRLDGQIACAKATYAFFPLRLRNDAGPGAPRPGVPGSREYGFPIHCQLGIGQRAEGQRQAQRRQPRNTGLPRHQSKVSQHVLQNPGRNEPGSAARDEQPVLPGRR